MRTECGSKTFKIFQTFKGIRYFSADFRRKPTSNFKGKKVAIACEEGLSWSDFSCTDYHILLFNQQPYTHTTALI